MMTDLRWAIGRYDGPGYDEWYIYDVETDTTICDSPVRETLAMILELLVVCQSLVANLPDELFEWIGDSISWSNVSAIRNARDEANAVIAKVKSGT